MMKKRMKAQRNGPDQEVILMMMMISFCMPQAGCTSVSFK